MSNDDAPGPDERLMYERRLDPGRSDLKAKYLDLLEKYSDLSRYV